ncbi:hypothetical protein QBC46DRAFT_448817 [Diplogelasinospora grovesii]|uniref:Uncharacterized protein n=1 Tax=Diplogelasinospora grovesii TaxID=303347 RepID=A0AAN6S626_9PEZI|nr:hypothetical protein QBC46DRAFT_448817 [Diplogelasinospora grovesii]
MAQVEARGYSNQIRNLVRQLHRQQHDDQSEQQAGPQGPEREGYTLLPQTPQQRPPSPVAAAPLVIADGEGFDGIGYYKEICLPQQPQQPSVANDEGGRRNAVDLGRPTSTSTPTSSSTSHSVPNQRLRSSRRTDRTPLSAISERSEPSSSSSPRAAAADDQAETMSALFRRQPRQLQHTQNLQVLVPTTDDDDGPSPLPSPSAPLMGDNSTRPEPSGTGIMRQPGSPDRGWEHRKNDGTIAYSCRRRRRTSDPPEVMYRSAQAEFVMNDILDESSEFDDEDPCSDPGAIIRKPSSPQPTQTQTHPEGDVQWQPLTMPNLALHNELTRNSPGPVSWGCAKGNNNNNNTAGSMGGVIKPYNYRNRREKKKLQRWPDADDAPTFHVSLPGSALSPAHPDTDTDRDTPQATTTTRTTTRDTNSPSSAPNTARSTPSSSSSSSRAAASSTTTTTSAAAAAGSNAKKARAERYPAKSK